MAGEDNKGSSAERGDRENRSKLSRVLEDWRSDGWMSGMADFSREWDEGRMERLMNAMAAETTTKEEEQEGRRAGGEGFVWTRSLTWWWQCICQTRIVRVVWMCFVLSE